jgi:hypothetical protein
MLMGDLTDWDITPRNFVAGFTEVITFKPHYPG